MVFFPTTSSESNNCIWISLNNISSYEEKDFSTVVTFTTGQRKIVDISLESFENQVLRASKLLLILKKRKQSNNSKLFDSYVTDINTWKTAEITETNKRAGRYTYYITETQTARERYVNILENINTNSNGESYFNSLMSSIGRDINKTFNETCSLVNKNSTISNQVKTSILEEFKKKQSNKFFNNNFSSIFDKYLLFLI